MGDDKTVIVTGGRDFNDVRKVFMALSALQPDRIVQGGATGADAFARQFAEEYGIKCLTFHADWDQFGKAAGPIRNDKMLSAYPDAIVLVFAGGRGTENCARIAIDKRMTVLRAL